MDFTKWEKLVNNIQGDVVVPFEVVEKFLNELDQFDKKQNYYSNYHKNICFEELGLGEFDGPIVEAYKQQEQVPTYKKIFSKISKEELYDSPFIYLTVDGYVIPFTYSCFKQLIQELKDLIEND